ncbi:MAG: KxYKxGKxW signal peptide domain-containing protein [Streptococcus sp.]
MHKVKKNWVTIGVTALSMVTVAVELWRTTGSGR